MLVLPAELTHATAGACARMLGEALRKLPGSTVVVDAAALKVFDSSALAVLLECGRDARGAGKGFAVAAMPTRLRELATVYGVAGLLPAAP